jgi:hypothetical protein
MRGSVCDSSRQDALWDAGAFEEAPWTDWRHLLRSSKIGIAYPSCEKEADVAITNSSLEDVRIGVRLKISALWIGMLFLFAYGDIFGFFRRGVIEEVIAGKVSGIEITQTFLFAVSVYIAIASAMVFLTLVLRPRVNRWVNIALPILYIVSIGVSTIGDDWAYYYFLSIAESFLLLLIIWYAWTWPKQVTKP